MAAKGTVSPVLIDDITADKFSKINSELSKAILSALI